MKFSDAISIPSASREIDTIEDNSVDYGNLTVAVKVVTLKSGLQGLVSLDRFKAFQDSFVENEDGEAELPDSYKVGGTEKSEIGFWYNTAEFKKTKGTLKG
jgi:hypothetical protein